MVFFGALLLGFFSSSMIQLGDKVGHCEEKKYEEKYCEDIKKIKEFKESIHHD